MNTRTTIALACVPPLLALILIAVVAYHRLVRAPSVFLTLPTTEHVAPPVSAPTAASAPPAPAAPTAAAPATTPAQIQSPTKPTLVKNGDFSLGLTNWSFWQHASESPSHIRVIQTAMSPDQYALRIYNPDAKLCGVQQIISVVSGTVYRLHARARSIATVDSHVIFGGRVALYLPPQPEHELVWMSESTNWWTKSIIITNHVTGIATLYVHLGYGQISTTGDFSNIALEEVLPE